MALFTCLAAAVVLQSLWAVVLCLEGAVIDEKTGRTRLAEKDRALGVLKDRALMRWEPGGYQVAPPAGGVGGARVAGELSDVPEGKGWLMEATVRQEQSTSRLVTSALVERGRDGIDLPLAAAVADTVTASGDRIAPWVEVENPGVFSSAERGFQSGAPLYVCRPLVEPNLGLGCTVAFLSTPWRLDGGWASLGSQVSNAGGATVAGGDGVMWVQGRFGRLERVPEGDGLFTPDNPTLLVVTGGANLDACGLGDVHGVIVVDGGSVSLDGTVVHGAVFATGNVDLGLSGRLVYSRPILRWATDRSLSRVRLVPGSRWEGME